MTSVESRSEDYSLSSRVEIKTLELQSEHIQSTFMGFRLYFMIRINMVSLIFDKILYSFYSPFKRLKMKHIPIHVLSKITHFF